MPGPDEVDDLDVTEVRVVRSKSTPVARHAPPTSPGGPAAMWPAVDAEHPTGPLRNLSGPVAPEDDLEAEQRQPRLVLGEHRALLDDQRREAAGGDHRDVAGLQPSSSIIRPTMPSTWHAKPKSIPDCSASTVFLAITERGRSSSTLRSWAPRRPSASREISMPGRDRAADVLARAR